MDGEGCTYGFGEGMLNINCHTHRVSKVKLAAHADVHAERCRHNTLGGVQSV